MNTLEKRFGEARNKAEQFAAATRGISNAASAAGNAAEKSAPKMGKFVQSIARIAKYRMIRAVIRSIIDAFKEGAEQFYNFTKESGGEFSNYAAALDKVKSATGIMKAQLGAAWGSLYANIAPVIESLVDLVTRFANVLTMIFAKLGGASGWYKATAGVESYGAAVGGAGQAAKEAMKYLAPFDELNRLPADNQSGGGGGGGSSSGGGAQYEWVDFDTFDIGDGIASIFGWVQDAFNDMSAWLESVDWMNLASNIISTLGDAFGKVDWAGFTQSVAEFLGAAIGAVSAFLVGALSDLVTWISDKLYDLFHNDDGTAKTGEEIVAGIWNGIVTAITNVGEWIKTNVVDPFVKGFKAAFGIASPAKEMEEPGQMVGEGILAGIANAFTAINTWLQEHVVNPIKNFLNNAGLGNLTIAFKTNLSNFKLPNLKDFKKVWDSIKNKTATLTGKYKGTAVSTFTNLANKWNAIKTKASTLTASLKQSFSTSAINSIYSAWNSISNKTAKFTATLSASATVQNFVSAWNKLANKSLELKAKLSETVTSAWNKAATAWNKNSVLSKLVTLPYLAKGGIVDQATWIGNAIVGEAGKEAIVPLENNTEWIGLVVSGVMKQLAGMSGGMDYDRLGNAMYNAMSRALSENKDDRDIMLDGNVLYRAMVQRNRRETFASGTNPMMAMA